MTAHPIDTDRLLARIARLEAQSDIRGRAVAIYRERAKDAEGWAALWKETARHHIEGERFADAHIDKWRRWGERLHETHMAEVRDREARIKAVQDLIDQADTAGDWAITCSRLQWAIDGTTPNPYRASETA